MSKVATLFFMALFLCYMFTDSARPEPAFQKESLVVTQQQVGFLLLMLMLMLVFTPLFHILVWCLTSLCFIPYFMHYRMLRKLMKAVKASKRKNAWWGERLLLTQTIFIHRTITLKTISFTLFWSLVYYLYFSVYHVLVSGLFGPEIFILFSAFV